MTRKFFLYFAALGVTTAAIMIGLVKLLLP
jgi:hypothetical protein